MPISVVMPALEMAQETGKLISWLKKEGDAVSKGQPLLEIETDKAVMEVESPGEGVLAGVKVQAGAEVPVGRTIAWILRPGETVPTEETPFETGRKSTAPVQPTTTASANTPAVPVSREFKISPKARRLAAEHGVNLAHIKGSGPGGEILASDIVAAAARPAASARAQALSATARLMAERTTQSWTTVPHIFLSRDVDASAMAQAREQLAPVIEQSRGVKLTYTDLLVALVGRVLRKHPKLNSSWSNGSIRANDAVNICVAVAVDEGVVAPVIREADKIELGEIALQRRDLSERARTGKLRPADLADGTFTISNLGMFGVDAFTAIITPPQAAILAVGSVADRVIPEDGHPVIRPMVTLTLSTDHRVVDGARAAEFLRDLSETIAKPQGWLRF
jgi:pyruvate dehydrogenase E2 component (dihydrolipoamide acetyltransferase)